MSPKVAIVEFESRNVENSLQQALRLIGGIGDLNTSERSLVIKVGVFSHRAGNHSSVDVVGSIVSAFRDSPHVYVVESDNYQGTGWERLELWRELFNERVVPFNLSDDPDMRKVTLAGIEMGLSSILFKPNILVDTHIFRTYEKGSILKNLFGCTPTSEKAKYHKDTIFYNLLADIYEVVGGIDLAVLDGTHLWHDGLSAPMNVLVVGRDAVAVETVGACLAGLKPEKMRVIQEFVKRGLGAGELGEIDVVGVPFEDVRERCAAAKKRLAEVLASRPAPWSPAKTVDQLIREGFFNAPLRRTNVDIVKAALNQDRRAEGRSKDIMIAVSRRAKKGVLKSEKGPEGVVFWKE